jgi:hypothetical protein
MPTQCLSEGMECKRDKYSVFIGENTANFIDMYGATMFTKQRRSVKGTFDSL